VTTFVLIPGAGTDPRVYGATIEALRHHGHHGLAPPLPLDDEDAGPSDHAAAVVRAASDEADVAVVAQSLGAFAGPLVAQRLGAVALILIAPMIPRPGETAGEWWGNTGHSAAISELIERYGPMAEWGQEAMAEVFLHDVDPAVARESAEHQRAPGAGISANRGRSMHGQPCRHVSWRRGTIAFSR
jgi:Alpha/beta hydrolase family